MLGEQGEYLQSIICFHNFDPSSWYLCLQVANRHRLRFLRSRIPRPPPLSSGIETGNWPDDTFDDLLDHPKISWSSESL
jgi:hypothetical protein